MDEPQIISTPGNGKRWWKETWGKAVGMVLGTLTLLALYWVGGKTFALGVATADVYTLPPRVKAIEEWKATLPSPAPTVPESKVDRLIALLEAQANAKASGKGKSKP
jgi:hypothetical protein